MHANFSQLTTRSESRQWQRWVLTRCDDQVHLMRLMFYQVAQGLMYFRVADHMIIIQHQHYVIVQPGYVIDQFIQNGVYGRTLRHLK